MAWYNGYPEKQREAKYKVLQQLLRGGILTPPPGPCMLCGDPEILLEPHSEDYSDPFLWDPPAMYWLCRNCHRSKLHGRFRNPGLWTAFLAHVRRGGYAREWNEPSRQKEIRQFRAALKKGDVETLPMIRSRNVLDDWWERLSTDPRALTSEWARPRPIHPSTAPVRTT
jgi:hypothetical protein